MCVYPFEYRFHCQDLNRFAINIVCFVDSDKFSAQYSLLMGYGDAKFQNSQVSSFLRNADMYEEWKFNWNIMTPGYIVRNLI